MAETKFTKGPWAIDGWHTSAVIAKLPDETYVRVADCDTPSFPNPDWKANTRLIAAAPALYEALEKIVADAPEAHEPYPAGGQSSADDEYERGAGNQHFYLANIARAALALAEGKQ